MGAGLHPYWRRTAVLATMHAKEQAIAPVFRNAFEMQLVVPAALDTDALGTFSGEIARQGTMGEVAIRKARLAMAMTGYPIGLASEGTFGNHPAVPFANAGMELMVVVDEIHGMTISESLVTTEIVFDKRIISPDEDLLDWLDFVQFPAHWLIVQPHSYSGPPHIFKDIGSYRELHAAISGACQQSEDGKCIVSTDMRAHRNPTRMRSLEILAEKLAARLGNLCLHCGCPGFGRVRVEPGLRCEECGSPTKSVHLEIFGCSKCSHEQERARPDGKIREKAQYCDYCNP